MLEKTVGFPNVVRIGFFGFVSSIDSVSILDSVLDFSFPFFNKYGATSAKYNKLKDNECVWTLCRVCVVNALSTIRHHTTRRLQR